MSFEFNLIFVLTAAIGILTPRRAEESTGEPGWAHLPNKPNSLPWQGWTYQTCAQHILKYRILHNPRLSMPKKAKQVGNAFWAVPTAGPYNRFCHTKWVKIFTVVLYRNLFKGTARWSNFDPCYSTSSIVTAKWVNLTLVYQTPNIFPLLKVPMNIYFGHWEIFKAIGCTQDWTVIWDWI